MKRIFLIGGAIFLSKACFGWDMGLDFRNSKSYVTDAAYGVAITTNDINSHTLSNSNGDSVTVQLSHIQSGFSNRNSSNDARVAGMSYNNLIAGTSIQITLPATGNYNIGAAIGDPSFAQGGSGSTIQCRFSDSNTFLFTVSTGSTLGAGHFLDAKDTEFTSAANWVSGNATQAVTFATTTLNVLCLVTSTGVNIPISHIRITSTGGGGASASPQTQQVIVTGDDS